MRTVLTAGKQTVIILFSKSPTLKARGGRDCVVHGVDRLQRDVNYFSFSKNTFPFFGKKVPEAIWLLTYADKKLLSIPITSPVDFISKAAISDLIIFVLVSSDTHPDSCSRFDGAFSDKNNV